MKEPKSFDRTLRGLVSAAETDGRIQGGLERGNIIHASNKRASRITDARLAVKQGQRWVETHPGASASTTIRDMKLALQGMLDEVDGK